MNQMNITNAQYYLGYMSDENDGIKATIDGEVVFVPLEVGNRHYDEILRQVEAGTLTISDAE